MGETEIKIKKYACEKCGHAWIPKNQNKRPRVCPNSKCHSAWWDTPRKNKAGDKK